MGAINGCQINAALAKSRITLKVVRGQYLNQRLEWQNGNEVPLPMTGYTARMHIRESLLSGTTVLELETGGSGLSIDEPNGFLDIDITKLQSADFPKISLVWDIELTPPSGESFIWVEGDMTVADAVTRD